MIGTDASNTTSQKISKVIKTERSFNRNDFMTKHQQK
jgi:hypothetical protein